MFRPYCAKGHRLRGPLPPRMMIQVNRGPASHVGPRLAWTRRHRPAWDRLGYPDVLFCVQTTYVASIHDVSTLSQRSANFLRFREQKSHRRQKRRATGSFQIAVRLLFRRETVSGSLFSFPAQRLDVISRRVYLSGFISPQSRCTCV